MTGGRLRPRPLLVAGVAGGVGTSTWARVLQTGLRFPVADAGVYRGGVVDVLVSSNTAASTARIGRALSLCPRPPLLVVMHSASGQIAESRSHLRAVEPHITARFDIEHRRSWLETAEPPGRRLSPKDKDLTEALRRFPEALRQMYAATSPTPARTVAAPAAGAGLGHPLAAAAASSPWRPPAGFQHRPR